ncbi:MAG: type II toxin-antitoxin system RatA family toxin [Pseudomonadota bacterium]
MPQHSESRNLPFSAEQMFDLVADVEAYPLFLPWTAAARVRSVRDRADGAQEMDADLIVSFKVFRERFGSRVVLWDKARKIETEYIDGPFKHMRSNWIFTPGEDGCTVQFDVDFAFRNLLLQSAAEVFFYEAMRRIVRAFENRAQVLYGS